MLDWLRAFFISPSALAKNVLSTPARSHRMNFSARRRERAILQGVRLYVGCDEIPTNDLELAGRRI